MCIRIGQKCLYSEWKHVTSNLLSNLSQWSYFSTSSFLGIRMATKALLTRQYNCNIELNLICSRSWADFWLVRNLLMHSWLVLVAFVNFKLGQFFLKTATLYFRQTTDFREGRLPRPKLALNCVGGQSSTELLQVPVSSSCLFRLRYNFKLWR